MSHLPQIAVILWITITTAVGVAGAVRRPTGWVVLKPNHQRRVAAAIATSALGEASLLWSAGFFKGMF